MKRLFTLLVLFSTFTLFSQTEIDLSGLTGDITLGQNCSASQTPQEFVTTGDLNLNGFELKLKNVNLTVNGNVNGGGEIDGCGQSNVCVTGAIQNNPELDDVTLNCSTLSSDNFKLDSSNYSYSRVTKLLTVEDVKFIIIYDLTGRQILNSKENVVDLSRVNTNIVIVKTDRGSLKLIK